MRKETKWLIKWSVGNKQFEKKVIGDQAGLILKDRIKAIGGKFRSADAIE